MTREEAIQVLKRTIAYESDFAEAKRMAIEALSEPKTDGDLISRQDAIETVKELNEKINDGIDHETICTSDVVRRINALPSRITEYTTFCGVPIEEAARIVQEHNAEPKTETVLCALADRSCPFQGKEYAWCLTCPHISDEDRDLVKKAVAEPNTGWIPVSERLPTGDGEYLVAYPMELGETETEVDILNYGKPTIPTEKVCGRCWYDTDAVYWDVVYDDVVAWMPLPDSYRQK